MIWKALFSALGLGSFIYILHGYGFSVLATDIAGLGWWSVPLALSFVPVVFCYALAWLLITPEMNFSSHIFPLFRLSAITVAWNNLSPFVKVLGEPVRVIALTRYLDRKAAARSTVLYNIVHSLGTLVAFFLGALLLLLFFPVDPAMRTGLISLLGITPVLVAALFFLPWLAKLWLGRSSRRNKLVVVGFWVRWSLFQIRTFSARYPLRFWLAVVVEVAARFIEGVTFYIAFRALGRIVPAYDCALLDVGRALMDNIFFFIPYQVGSREGGLILLSEHALKISSAAAVSAAVFYRLVEILWMGIGYFLWIAEERARKSST